MYDAVLSETVTITGHGGDAIEAYSGAIPIPDERVVAELEQALREAGKTYEFHSYDGANHGFMQVDSARYHPQSAVDAWGRILEWFGRYLAA